MSRARRLGNRTATAWNQPRKQQEVMNMNTLDNREIINSIRRDMIKRQSPLFIVVEVGLGIVFLACLLAIVVMGLAL